MRQRIQSRWLHRLMRSSRKLDETTNFYWARSWLELYPQAGGPLLYFRVSSPKHGLVAKCWDCNNWGCATSRAFREVAPLRGGRQGFRHRRLVCPVTARVSSCRYATVMRRNLTRYYGAGDLHFITCSCYARQPLLGTARRRELFLHVWASMSWSRYAGATSLWWWAMW